MKTASFLSLLFVFSGLAAAQPGQQFLIVSDIHFNPLANPALAGQLMAAEPSQWESIFAADAHSPAQKYMEDSSWALFSALITGMQNIQPRPRLVILTGDVLAHKFQDKFNAATQSAGPAAFRSFVSKTFTFIGLELQKGRAGVPVVSTLGNMTRNAAITHFSRMALFCRIRRKWCGRWHQRKRMPWRSGVKQEVTRLQTRSPRIIELLP